MDGFFVILAFLALFVLGFPVVLAIALPCLGYIFVNDLPLDLVAQRTLYALDSFPLVAVPVFLFVGSVMNSAGISRYIYKFADTAVGRLPGGLAQVNIFGSLIFAGMSGSALADIGGLGRIEIDAMRNKGFKAPFAAAVTTSSAIVGPIFPPSIPLIIYGTVTGVSVIQLLLGGILPGILCVVMLMAMTGWLALRRKYPRTERWPTGAELWRDLKPALPAIMAPVILIAGMLVGFFTPTEIAAVTVLYALLISSVFYRELTWKGILDASYETIRSSSGILLIVAVAALFGWILSVEGCRRSSRRSCSRSRPTRTCCCSSSMSCSCWRACSSTAPRRSWSSRRSSPSRWSRRGWTPCTWAWWWCSISWWACSRRRWASPSSSSPR